MKLQKYDLGKLILGLGLGFSLLGVGGVEANPVADSDTRQEALVELASQAEMTTQAVTIRDHEAGFQFTIPFKINDLARVNSNTQTDSGHIIGYTANIAEFGDDQVYGMSFSRRDNQKPKGVSQKTWNTTWYDVPVKGMTDEEYHKIWREHSDVYETNDVLGGLIRNHAGADSARWSQITPKEGTFSLDKVPESRKNSFFEAEFIMKADPTHRYILTATYPLEKADLMTKHLWDTTIKSFRLLTAPYKAEGDVLVDSGISLIRPQGFERNKRLKEWVEYTKGDMVWDVQVLPTKFAGYTSQYPLLTDKVRMAQTYLNTFAKDESLHISRTETDVDNFQMGTTIVGYTEDKNFLIYTAMTDDNRVVVSRLTAPRQMELDQDTWLSLVQGVRIEPYRDTDVKAFAI